MTRGWQPNISAGVFETLLVVDGEPIELDAHLRRLEKSLKALYSRSLPDDIGETARSAAQGVELGRLRLTSDLTVDVVAIDPEIVFPSEGVRLRTRSLAGGLGAHKWLDRAEIGRPARAEAGPILVDEGEMLEAGWANVFAVRGGTLFTPPLDGRILPGTTRAALLTLAPELDAEVREQPLRQEDLLTADEVFLTGSIRGIEAAQELDGEPLNGRGPLSRRLAAALRRRWGLGSESDALPAPAAAPLPGPPAR